MGIQCGAKGRCLGPMWDAQLSTSVTLTQRIWAENGRQGLSNGAAGRDTNSEQVDSGWGVRQSLRKVPSVDT